MEIIKVILPVLLMIALGVICRKIKLLTQDGVQSIKNIVVKIMLPVAIFSALGKTVYSVETVIIIAIMLGAIIVSFLMGYLLRFLVKGQYRKYIPFMVSIYEGGMMGYPLYINLC